MDAPSSVAVISQQTWKECCQVGRLFTTCRWMPCCRFLHDFVQPNKSAPQTVCRRRGVAASSVVVHLVTTSSSSCSGGGMAMAMALPAGRRPESSLPPSLTPAMIHPPTPRAFVFLPMSRRAGRGRGRGGGGGPLHSLHLWRERERETNCPTPECSRRRRRRRRGLS